MNQQDPISHLLHSSPVRRLYLANLASNEETKPYLQWILEET